MEGLGFRRPLVGGVHGWVVRGSLRVSRGTSARRRKRLGRGHRQGAMDDSGGGHGPDDGGDRHERARRDRLGGSVWTTARGLCGVARGDCDRWRNQLRGLGSVRSDGWRGNTSRRATPVQASKRVRRRTREREAQHLRGADEGGGGPAADLGRVQDRDARGGRGRGGRRNQVCVDRERRALRGSVRAVDVLYLRGGRRPRDHDHRER